MPASVIKSNLYNYNSIASAIRSIYSTEGIRGFFYGFGATALRDAPYAGIYVLAYHELKNRMEPFRTSRYQVGVDFGCGVVGGIIATSLTHPFDMIKTRIQLLPHEFSNLYTAIPRIFKDEGIKAFFSGFSSRVLRKSLNSAITWAAYEHLLRRFSHK